MECRNSITGILVYWARTRQFMQVLEGSEKAIFDLYEDIKKDDRHKCLKLIYSGETPERYFSNWREFLVFLKKDLPTC